MIFFAVAFVGVLVVGAILAALVLTGEEAQPCGRSTW
jgi:hypothetical protein